MIKKFIWVSALTKYRKMILINKNIIKYYFNNIIYLISIFYKNKIIYLFKEGENYEMSYKTL